VGYHRIVDASGIELCGGTKFSLLLILAASGWCGYGISRNDIEPEHWTSELQLRKPGVVRGNNRRGSAIVARLN